MGYARTVAPRNVAAHIESAVTERNSRDGVRIWRGRRFTAAKSRNAGSASREGPGDKNLRSLPCRREIANYWRASTCTSNRQNEQICVEITLRKRSSGCLNHVPRPDLRPSRSRRAIQFAGACPPYLADT